MRQLDKIQKTLLDRNYYFLVPNQLTAMPVEMAKMQKDDEDGNLLDGEYYSIDDLANHFGSFYELITWVDNNHTLVTWGTSKNDEIPAVIDLLVSKGLTDVRVDAVTGNELETSEIDWSTLTPTDFAIFTLPALRDVPKMIFVETGSIPIETI